nr:reverse transcriptase domain-containing protein [Tanacetum cinerariifolium]
MLLGRTAMQKMGIVVSTIHEAIKFHTEIGIRTVLSINEANERTKRAKRIPATSNERVLSCVNAEEKIIVNDKYPDQTAYPKDCYPLLEIDWKIESLSGFLLKCSLDAYKGYHQIQIAEEDEDKTTFYAGEGVFCYKKMSFGLKNAVATYQRFRSINMKLNLKKCSFGVEKGPFLGHLITKHGIKANPSKVKAVTDLDQPRILKDIQSLSEKLAALSRFLSKGAERSLAFFKILKGCKDKKSIQWTTEADKALEKIKKLVQTFPTLNAPRGPIRSKTQPSYLGEACTGLGSRSKKTSKILSGSYNNSSHKHGRKETPANFFVEIPSEDNEMKEKLKEVPNSSSKWRLYTDRASNSDESRAMLMLIDPKGKEYTYALRFEFEITNNKEEYEALLAGTFTAKQASIKDYLQKVKTALRVFEDYTVEHILRNQNMKADALSKLASMTFKHLTKEVLVKVLTKRSIEEKEVLKVETQERKN